MTFKGALALFAVGILASCATAPAPVNYAPSSVLSATGSVCVGDFRYLPCDNGAVAKNQIKNTALGKIEIDRDVKDFFRDALFAELRFVGVKLDNKNRLLLGDISEFLIDDLGFNVDWSLKVRYAVKDMAENKVLFESEKVVQRRTAKFVNPFGALNETIKLNVEQLLRDPEFMKAVQ